MRPSTSSANRSTAEKPFLAVVWFGSPHGPHQALDIDREAYADLPKQDQHFLGEITGMDRAFGKLRAEIKDLGIRDNTILWYNSDNGALPKVGSTGGHRGYKGKVYEGGLLVPAILEWPAVIKAPRITNVRCNTADIYPTLLDIVGVTMEDQPPLDGISLKPLIEEGMAARGQGMGFWDYTIKGISTPSAKWMADLLAAQQAGAEPDDPEKLRLDAAEIKKQYPKDVFPGHAAWIDGDWKLHRITDNSGKVKLELYNLAADPEEAEDLARTTHKQLRHLTMPGYRIRLQFQGLMEQEDTKTTEVASLFPWPAFRGHCHSLALRAEGPDVCLAQPNGLGVGTPNPSKGQRPGRLCSQFQLGKDPAACEGSETLSEKTA
jgi:hypothetical protein